MSLLSSLLSKIFGLNKHEQLQEQRIQYLETELNQTKEDLQEVQSLLGSMNADLEFALNSVRANKNAIRNVQRKVKKAAADKKKSTKQ